MQASLTSVGALLAASVLGGAIAVGVDQAVGDDGATTVIGGPLDLDGTLAVETGMLDAAAGDGGLGTDGSIVVGPGGRLRLSGARTIGPAGSVTGGGILEVTTSGTLSVPATATWTVTTTYLTGNGSLTLDGERTLDRLWVFVLARRCWEHLGRRVLRVRDLCPVQREYGQDSGHPSHRRVGVHVVSTQLTHGWRAHYRSA